MTMNDLQLPYGGNLNGFVGDVTEDFSSCGQDIEAIADYLSKSDNEFPLDVANLPSAALETPPRLSCDVTHQLHGDQHRRQQQQQLQHQQQEEQQLQQQQFHQQQHLQQQQFQQQQRQSQRCEQHLQKFANRRPSQNNNRFHNDTSKPSCARQSSSNGFQHNHQNEECMRLNYNYSRRCPPLPCQAEIYNSHCLPESPPDSEPYSPQRDANPAHQDCFLQGNQRHESLQKDQCSFSPCERPLPHLYNNRMSLDGRLNNSCTANYNINGNEPPQNAVSGMPVAMYGDADNNYCENESSISILSPASISSEHSVLSSPGMSYNCVPSKKRKYSDPPQQIPEQLNAGMLTYQYRQMIQQQQQQQPIKQEPDLLRAARSNIVRGGYINDGCEIVESGNRLQHPLTISGSVRLAEAQDTMLHIERNSPSSGGMLPSYIDVSSAYQVIKWLPFNSEKWSALHDASGNELQTVSYRVDADKGFNFAVADDTFVCQKKNHFQVTVHIGVVGHPRHVKTEDGLIPIEGFFISLYGVKYESQSQTIAIEQSQSDRSKKAFHPVKVDLPGDQVTKITVGRLHFSETTTNNMRKKGRPNPDQRYFMCIVELLAKSGGKNYTVTSSGTEKIIVRASNPGQFDQDDVQWQRGQIPDAIYHNGKVGINYDHPDEALVVHGNVKVTGRVLQPSDRRAKEDVKEVDTSSQLKNVANIRLCKYKYTPEYANYAGIDSNREETGVIAQEFAEIIPEAVKQTGDIHLPNGEVIPSFLVVDKDRLYMENVGAVKELYKVTGHFEDRIDELERLNKKLAKFRRFGSVRSAVSGFTTVSSTPSVSRQSSTRYPSNHKLRNSNKRTKVSVAGTTGCMSNRYVQYSVLALLALMTVSVVVTSTVNIMTHKNSEDTSGQADNPLEAVYLKGTSGELQSSSSANKKRPKTNRKPTHFNFSLTPISYCPLKSSCTQGAERCCGSGGGGSRINVPCLFQKKVHEGLFPTVPPEATNKQQHTGRRNKGKIKHINEHPFNHHSHHSHSKRPRFPLRHAGVDDDVIFDDFNRSKTLDAKLADSSSNILQSVHGKQISKYWGWGPKSLKTVHTIRKRSLMDTYTLTEVQTVLLVEPNVTLYDVSFKRNPYLQCSGVESNYIFNIPVADSTPPDTRVTLRIKMKEKANVMLCGVPQNDGSACSTSSTTSKMITQTGKSVRFMIYFSNYVTADYKFRITTADDGQDFICNALSGDIGKKYREYLFHFYRLCHKQHDAANAGNIPSKEDGPNNFLDGQSPAPSRR